MATANLSCTICSENYRESDEITCTSCGHIFHSSCFQDWQSRSTTCPECRSENLTTHRVFLHIEDPPEPVQPPSLLTNQLEERVSLLQQELDESEKNFLAFHVQFCTKEDQIAELGKELETQKAENESKDLKIEELKLQLEISEKNFLQTLELQTVIEKELNDRKTEIDFLKIQNKMRNDKLLEVEDERNNSKTELEESRELHEILKNQLKISEDHLQQLSTEMNDLKLDNKAKETILQQKNESNVHQTALEISLQERIKVLEQKNKQLSVELDKEIKNSMTLTVDIMKLRHIISLDTPNDNKREIIMQQDEMRNKIPEKSEC